jgi:hypothetical protein
MSLTLDGQSITCDWCGCTTAARLPVALHAVLTPAEKSATAEGWLCVTTRNDTHHFCPTCGAAYSKTLEECVEDPPPEIRLLADVAPAELGA